EGVPRNIAHGKGGTGGDVGRAEEDGHALDAGGGVGGVGNVPGEIDAAVEVGLFEVGQQVRAPAPARPQAVAVHRRGPRLETGRQTLVDAMVVVKGQADLFEVVLALQTTGRFADFLDGGHQ